MNTRFARVAFAVAVLMTVLRLAVSAHVGLGDDEAYYWDWSRHFSLSYYDHPAMVAWLIRAGTEIFGTTSLGVRFFGLVSAAVSAWYLWLLAKALFDERIAWATILVYSLVPILSVGGVLMVPDAPLAACWIAFTYLLWRIWSEPQSNFKLWVAAGAVLGLGLLSKYPMILCGISGLALFAFSSRRSEFLRPRLYVAMAIAALFCLPIILWNVQYDWPSLKFHLQERQTGGGGANFVRWAQYFVSQAGALGPALFLSCIAVLVTAFRRSRDRRWRFIALVSSPPLFIFTSQALFAEFKLHWPVPAYPLLFIGACALYFEWRERKAKSFARAVVVGLVFTYFILVNAVAYVAAVKPIIPKLARSFAPQTEWDPKFDPTNDLYGWPEVVNEANRIRDEEVNARRSKPFLSSYRYQLVSQLAFAAHETAVKVGSAKDEYTFTQTEAFLKPYVGRTSLFITDHRYERDPATDHRFESCKEMPRFEVYREGELARIFHIWFCRGFKG